MTWDGADAEGLAKWIYDAAGFDMADPPGPVRLAKALEIDVKTAPRRHLWGHGTKVRIQGRRVIYVAPKLAPEHHAFAVAHEIAEWQLDGREDDETEGLCDAVAAALIAPAPAFRWMLDDHGPDLITLAEGFSTTQSCVALRLGEVTGRPMALVSPRLVRVRGDDWGWPAEDEIRRLSRARSLPTELTAVRLTDDPRRVFLQAALAQQLKRSILFARVDRHSYTYLTNRRRGPRRPGDQMTAYEIAVSESDPRTADQLALDAWHARSGAETCRLRGDKKGARFHEERAARADYVASVKRQAVQS